MRKNIKRTAAIVLSAALGLSVFAGCGENGSAKEDEAAKNTQAAANEQSADTQTADSQEADTQAADTETADTEAAADGEVTVIQVGTLQNYKPWSYHDENGKLVGYEVEVIQAVDELLPQYEFEFNEGAQDANYTALETGVYQLVLSNAFYTDKRAENYNIPTNPLGASPSGYFVAAENAEKYDTLEKIAADGAEGIPLMVGDGMTFQYDKYNEEHPDSPLKFEYTNSNAFQGDQYQFVAEGRYQWSPLPYTVWTSVVEAEDGPYHEFNDQLKFYYSFSVPTYAIIEKGNDELTAAVDGALKELNDNGKLLELSLKYYGYDQFNPGIEQ